MILGVSGKFQSSEPEQCLLERRKHRLRQAGEPERSRVPGDREIPLHPESGPKEDPEYTASELGSNPPVPGTNYVG